MKNIVKKALFALLLVTTISCVDMQAHNTRIVNRSLGVIGTAAVVRSLGTTNCVKIIGCCAAMLVVCEIVEPIVATATSYFGGAVRYLIGGDQDPERSRP